MDIKRKIGIKIGKYLYNGNLQGLSILNKIIVKENIREHDLLLLGNKKSPLKLLIFVDENGFSGKIISDEGPDASDEFYEFCERMGLLPDVVNNLYGTFISFLCCWPYLIKDKIKLV